VADRAVTLPDRLLDAVAELAGVDRVLVMDETLQGESRSTFAVAAGDACQVRCCTRDRPGRR
jgi:hypothetical protein